MSTSRVEDIINDPQAVENFNLADAMYRQEYLQTFVYGNGVSPRDFSDEGKIEFIKTNVLALTDELHEALNEVGWKPWASSRHINRDAFKGELVDALHFFMNLCIAAGIDAPELLEGYVSKSAKNVKRQKDGYDGVSEKCPGCKRALDDDAVTCAKVKKMVGRQLYYTFWCDQTKAFTGDMVLA